MKKNDALVRNRRTVRKLTFLIEIDEIKALHLRNGIFAFYRQGELIHAFEPFNVRRPMHSQNVAIISINTISCL